MKIFYAHGKQDAERQINADVQALTAQLRTRAPDVEVCAGRDDFIRYFSAYGSWTAWAASIPRRYDAIVCRDATVGRATAQMVDAALRNRVRVALWTDQGFHRVTAIRARDPEDWKAGWTLYTE